MNITQLNGGPTCHVSRATCHPPLSQSFPHFFTRPVLNPQFRPVTLFSLYSPSHSQVPYCTMAPTNDNIAAATHALHADEALNVVTDVAPPLHLSTTFRYPDDPEDLVPAADLSGVCSFDSRLFYAIRCAGLIASL